MDHSKKNSEICIRCHECCKWMTFILKPDDPVQLKKYMQFYTQRGCEVRVNGPGKFGPGITLSIMVPSACPVLDEGTGMCVIYADRPVQCWEYDGRWDPHMRDICKLPRAGEGVHIDEAPEDPYHKVELADEVIQVSTPEGPNPFYQCPFCGALDPGDMICGACGKHMGPPPEEDTNG